MLGLYGTVRSQFDCSGYIVGWEGVIAAGRMTLAIQA
jgi:hypothetical protein